MAVEIKGFIPTSMLDWEGMIVSTLFLPDCNFRCPYCQNPDLILKPREIPTYDLEEIGEFLKEKEGWIEGVCVTGGEPCMRAGLAELLLWFKERGLGVKLDTNGSFPDRLSDLIKRGLVDFVAMDIKAPLEFEPYRRVAGIDREELLGGVKRSIDILKESGLEHEFRTTVVPTLLAPEDIVKIARCIEGAPIYALQNFSRGETLDPGFQGIRPFMAEEMEEMRAAAEPLVERCVVRGSVVGVGG